MWEAGDVALSKLTLDAPEKERESGVGRLFVVLLV